MKLPRSIRFLCIAVAPACGGQADGHGVRQTFYVDSRRGDDRATGLSPHASWRSLARLERQHLPPGTTVRLRRGSVWNEPLRIGRSGTAQAPIVFISYGTGGRPKIAPTGTVENAVSIVNAEHIHLSGLEITNSGSGSRSEAAVRRGVLIAADNIGTLRDIRISDLYIHDVGGTNARKDNGGIVFRTTGAERPSRFVDLSIERSIIRRVDRSGIVGQSDQLTRTNWFASLGVVIRDNYLQDLGGDAITPWATDGALVEHNIVRGAARRAPGYNAGIWQWSTDRTTIRLNDVGETNGTLDGQGYDSDYNSTGTQLLWNYSHDNDGGFLLICTPVKRDPELNVGNLGTVARWNISHHDHARTFNLSGADDVLVERNAIYTAPGEEVQLLLVSEWDGWSQGATFRDNLFVAGGVAHYGHGAARDEATGLYRLASGFGGARDVVLAGNRFVGLHKGLPTERPSHLAPRPVAGPANWTPPRLADNDAATFAHFLADHRRWMIRLMTQQFGRPPDLRWPSRPSEERLPGRFRSAATRP